MNVYLSTLFGSTEQSINLNFSSMVNSDAFTFFTEDYPKPITFEVHLQNWLNAFGSATHSLTYDTNVQPRLSVNSPEIQGYVYEELQVTVGATAPTTSCLAAVSEVEGHFYYEWSVAEGSQAGMIANGQYMFISMTISHKHCVFKCTQSTIFLP